MRFGRAVLTFSVVLAGLVLRPAAASHVAVPGTFPGYTPYAGAIHFHTGYSDGAKDTIPADAYEVGEAAGMAFMFVTEHSEWLSLPVEADEDCLIDPLGRPITSCLVEPENGGLRKWDAQAEQAANATVPDHFLALRGFEWSSPTQGHLGVLLSANHDNAYLDGGPATMEGFWQWFTRDPSLGGGADGLAVFNHPGRELKDGEVDFKFEDFRYVPEADARVVGLEVFNRNDDYFTPQPNGVGSMVEALDAGWHVGAVGAVDEHSTNWGRSDRSRTVLLVPAGQTWDADAVREALVARRFYATQDVANLAVSLTADGAPMGSRVNRPNGTTVTLAATASGGATLEIITNGGTLVTSGPSPLTADIASGWGEAWYLARATTDPGGPNEKKAYSSPVWVGTGAHAPGEWLAGDLHVHTIHGHDTCDTPFTDSYEGGACEEPWTWSFPPSERIALAKERGLDYLAITDHNNILSQQDPAYSSEQELVLLPAYENSLPGHAQMLGATQCYSSAIGGPIGSPGPHCSTGDGSVAAVTALRDGIRADGGAFQINHPGDIEPEDPLEDLPPKGNWEEEYGHAVVPDSVEVWNIGPWEYQPQLPAANDNDRALAFWEGFLDQGHRVAATGGSDSHWRLTSPVQGIGQPTTWVYATGRSWPAMVAVIRAGRTFISHQPPSHGSPRLYLDVDADGNGTFESMPGDEIPSTAVLRVRVEDVPAGAVARLVWDEGQRSPGIPVPPSGVLTIPLPEGADTWVRAELLAPDAEAAREAACDPVVGTKTTYCRNRLVMIAMTSPLYVP